MIYTKIYACRMLQIISFGHWQHHRALERERSAIRTAFVIWTKLVSAVTPIMALNDEGSEK